MSSEGETADRDDEYRQYIADVILEFSTEQGAIEKTEAYRRLREVTGRTSLTTVKNWMTYRNNFPDMASMARIVDHWQIPPGTVFPPHLKALLLNTPTQPFAARDSGRDAFADQVLISLHRAGDIAVTDKALSKYTDHPRHALLVRYEGGDMVDEVRPGELVLVDTTAEQIRGSGIYLLSFSPTAPNCIRFVDVLIGEPAVRLRGGTAMPSMTAETLPFSDGGIHGVVVKGRIVGVVRQL